MSSSNTFEQNSIRASLLRHDRRHEGKRRLPPEFTPGNTSVRCGRGKACTTSAGNKRLKSIVTSYLSSYSRATTKTEKSDIVTTILAVVRSQNPEEGVFVRQTDGVWWEVEDAVAREKVGCMIRDCLHMQYRSSTRAKFKRKKQAQEEQEGMRGYYSMTPFFSGSDNSQQDANLLRMQKNLLQDIGAATNRMSMTSSLRPDRNDMLGYRTSTTNPHRAPVDLAATSNHPMLQLNSTGRRNNLMTHRQQTTNTSLNNDDQYRPMGGSKDYVDHQHRQRRADFVRECLPTTLQDAFLTPYLPTERIVLDETSTSIVHTAASSESLLGPIEGAVECESSDSSPDSLHWPVKDRHFFRRASNILEEGKVDDHGDLPDDISGIFDE